MLMTKLKLKTMSKIKFRILIISALLAVASSVTAFGADVNDVYNLLNNTTNSYLNTIKNSNAQIESYSSNIYSKVNSMQSLMNTYLPSLLTISNHIGGIENTLNYISDVGFESNGIIFTSVNSTASNTSNIASYSFSILSGLTATLPDIKSSVVQLQQVLASDEDLAIRQDQASRVDAISDDFLSSSGDASVSLGDIGSAKDSVTNIKDSLSGGASQSQLWTVLGSGSDAWSWFSQSVANDLDQSGSQSRLRSSGFSTPYLDDYYRQVYNSLGGEYYD